MIINITYGPGVVSAPPAFKTDIGIAVDFWERMIADPMTITIAVDYQAQSTNAGSLTLAPIAYDTLKQALINDAKSPDDIAAILHLPAVDPTGGNLRLTVSQEIALGLIGNGSNIGASIIYSSNPVFAYAFNPAQRAVQNKIDFIGVVERDIADVLGFFSDVFTNPPGSWTLADLFRYASPGTLTHAPGGYFSIDGGNTNLNNFSNSVMGWTTAAGNDAFDAPFQPRGALLNVSQTDLRAMDVLGYDIALSAKRFDFPTNEIAAFGTNAGGWSSQNIYPRQLADVNGDGIQDIVAFGAGGVNVAIGIGGGHFGSATYEVPNFGPNAGGWSSQDAFPRFGADVNGDGLADIVGFGNGGVNVALATGNGHFAAITSEVANFGSGAGGWISQDQNPRMLADVNGDGRADIVGFGTGGVNVSLATGGGHFAAPTFELAAFGPNAGGWTSQDSNPRLLADVNGDGRADIVGFATGGVNVSLATFGGHFAQPTFELANFGAGAGGWASENQYPRLLADVNGDGMADIVGFGNGGAFVALATGAGHFAQPTFELAAFAPQAGGWSSQDTYPRMLGDVSGDGLADIVGFGSTGVAVALALHGPFYVWLGSLDIARSIALGVVWLT